MSEKFRFHVLGLPHTISSKEFVACAYTQKAVKFAKMMTERGHTVYHYGHEDSDLICTEHVPVLTNADWKIAYGDHDYKKNFFKFDINDYAYQTFYKNAIREVGLRKQPNDIILPFWGAGVRPICDAHPDLITVEPGIGYAGGHWAKYKIFESYAIYHAYYGLDSVGTCKQGFYDTVIPNYFDPDDFTFSDKKEDYFLFLGRVYAGKGVEIAIQVTEKIGAKLIIAGQNSLKEMGYKETPAHVTEIGYADVETRKKLMAGAKGAFVASLYNEPFGGVQIECLFSGTPTITTDWGAFSENNIHGLTGYRCRTFEEFVYAARNVDKIKPQDCRDWALRNFSLEKVAKMYEEFFYGVLNIYGKQGWYEPNDNRQDFDYRGREYPGALPKIDYDLVEREERPFADRLAVWVKDKINPTRVLDIGCGPGIHTYALNDIGINCQGLDIDERVDGKVKIIKGDLLKLDGTEQADLVICYEVLEHIDPQYCNECVESIFNTIEAGGKLIFTAAQPGQGGVGHINNRPREFWRKKFIERGLIQLPEVEEDLRNYCRRGYYMGWFVNNVLCFSKEV
jgi:glycosyltransferase involved in cell wall biosynthesis/SAM-dependent methyltransferase